MISRYAEVCRSLVRAGRQDLAEMVLAAGGVFARLQWAFQNVREFRNFKPEDQKPQPLSALIHIVLTWMGINPDPFLRDDRDPRDWVAQNEQLLSRPTEWAKYIPWLLRELCKPEEQDPSNLLLGNRDAVLAVLRRVGDVNRVSLRDVCSAVEERLHDRNAAPPDQGTELYRYPDGWTVQRLDSQRLIDQESERMNHCVRTYGPAALAGQIWSLRDPDGFPRVTIELSDDLKRVVQVQAKGNEFPKRHVPRLSEMIARLLNNDAASRLLVKDPTLNLKTDLVGADLREADLFDADLRGANLSGADLSGADLSRAYLNFANLSSADLGDADLSRADLTGADLSEADLRGADLRYANLSGADLHYANLSGAYLRGANLSDANLTGADLTGAILRSADLGGAKLRGADLSGAVDLDQAEGLDTVRHNADTKWPDGFSIEDYR